MTADAKPRLIYIPWSGIGDLIMALPLLASLRDHYTVLPVVQRHHDALTGILQEDGILESSLPVVTNLRLQANPNGTLQALRHIYGIAPDVTLIYGKKTFMVAALGHMLRTDSAVFSTLNRRQGTDPGRGWNLGRFHCLPSTGNQVEDHWRFADHLGLERREQRWRLSPAARERLKRTIPVDLAGKEYVVIAPWSSDLRRDAGNIYFKRTVDCVVRDLGMHVATTGSAAHAAESRHLTADVPEAMVFDLVGKTCLAELLGVIAGARFLVANDSGNMHLATLLGIPSVIFFSATSPAMLISQEWRENISPVQFPLSRSGGAPQMSNAERSTILDIAIPAALRQACQ